MKHVIYTNGREPIEVIAANPGVVFIDSQPGRVPEAVAEIAPEQIPHLIQALQAVYTELRGDQQ